MDLLYLHNMRQAKGRLLEYGLKLTSQKSQQTLVWFDDNLRPYHRAERLLAAFRGHNAGFVAGLIGVVSLEFRSHKTPES